MRVTFPPIVLVDDNPDDLFVLRQRLLRSGVENPIQTFEDGEEAMTHLKRVVDDPTTVKPCVMFLDLRMPRCGGFDVLKWVKAQPSLGTLPVYIVSTSNLPEDAARAAQLGAERFIANFPPPELMGAIVRQAMGRAA